MHTVFFLAHFVLSHLVPPQRVCPDQGKDYKRTTYNCPPSSAQGNDISYKQSEDMKPHAVNVGDAQLLNCKMKEKTTKKLFFLGTIVVLI